MDDDLVGSIFGVEPSGDSKESRDLTGDDGDLRRARESEGFRTR